MGTKRDRKAGNREDGDETLFGVVAKGGGQTVQHLGGDGTVRTDGYGKSMLGDVGHEATSKRAGV